ncbi:fungal-specific transcription factor domain-containing protein, partial [Zopfochytrium polystomum]
MLPSLAGHYYHHHHHAPSRSRDDSLPCSEEGPGKILKQATAEVQQSFFFDWPSSLTTTVVPMRPGADCSEQEILVGVFFRRSINVVQVVHRMSYLRGRHKAPAFLQAAVCAMGASDATLKSLPQDVMMYYYDFARSQAVQWFDSPSLENLQALLILAELSLHIGKNVCARMLSGSACRLMALLQIDTDPDDLPQKFSAVEKETRRRCWYLAGYIERYRTIATNRPECNSHSSNNMKLMCSDSLWLSLDPQAVNFFAPMEKGSPVDVFYSIFEVNLRTIKLASTSLKSPLQVRADNGNQIQDCLNEIEKWHATVPPILSMDIESLSMRLAEWATGPNHEATPIRWQVAAFCLYHGSKLNLTIGVLSRLLPTALHTASPPSPTVAVAP